MVAAYRTPLLARNAFAWKHTAKNAAGKAKIAQAEGKSIRAWISRKDLLADLMQ